MQPTVLKNSDKLSYFDFARVILEGEDLQSKLLVCEIDWSFTRQHYELPSLPGRKDKISFSEKQLKFPKTARLNETDKKAMALNSFANHELLAIEMMAAALLVYPHENRNSEMLKFKRGILKALKDEQNHFSLYVQRMNELGYEFGDFPLNDFFWRQMASLKTPSQYLAVMSLTFESANLDFAVYYKNIFQDLGDDKTANILDVVLSDEISHVAFGAHWLKKWKGNQSLWDYYQKVLPFPMTPARGKGIAYNKDLHQQSVQDLNFIQALTSYQDDFKITKRKKF